METIQTIPGTYLGPSLRYQAGEGTYVRDGSIYASLVGTTHIQQVDGKKPVVQILQGKPSALVPQIGHIVLARVIKTNSRHAIIRILVIGETPCKIPYKGLIR